jgi:hypothetical protein
MDAPAPSLAIPKTHRLGPVLLSILLILAAIAWFELRTTGGPLAEGGGSSSGGTRTGAAANVGDRLSFGVFMPIYRGDGTLVIDSLVPDRVPDGLRVLGYGRLTQGPGVGAVRSFPPVRSHLVPVSGAKITSGEGLVVVVGVEPTRDGVFTIPGFTLHYHAGFHTFAAHYQQAIFVCAPMVPTAQACS